MHPLGLFGTARRPWSWAGGIAVAVVLLMLLPVPPLAGALAAPPQNLREAPAATALLSGPRVSVPTLLAGPIPASGGSPVRGNVSVFVAFRLQHQTALDRLLSALSNPTSPDYRHYLTAGEFRQEFSPSAATYRAAVEYFSRVPG